MSCDVIANHNNITVSKLPKEADVIKTAPQFQNVHPAKKPLHCIVSTRHLLRFSQFKSLQAFILFRIAAFFTHAVRIDGTKSISHGFCLGANRQVCGRVCFFPLNEITISVLLLLLHSKCDNDHFYS